MKVIITGCTGLIGGAVLQQCLELDSITTIVALSRRELSVTHPKLTWIRHDDFSDYASPVLEQLEGARACIYCLGTNVPNSSPELNRKINFGYASSTARKFADYFAPRGPFRFVYLSGALVEKDQGKLLLFLAKNRKMRGELETALLALDQERRDVGFRVWIARPGFVQPQGAAFRAWAVGTVANAIEIQHIAASLVSLALGGAGGPLVENQELKELGMQLLSRNES